MRTWVWVAVALGAGGALAAPLRAQDGGSTASEGSGLLEFRFTPVRFAQLALWVERDGGEFLTTVRLTESVALRGIGNRPGASEMNSGFRWPYGRREGVLPIWAARRAAAPGAKRFVRVIYQDRLGEGLTARTTNDHSPDDYFCLSFDRMLSTRDALDAVSCASPFTSDKGRFITQADVAAGYAEPYEQPFTPNAFMRPLSYDSLYPPRRDVSPCTTPGDNCFDHADVGSFAAHARQVMPDIDAVTMATPPGGVAQQILFPIPPAWSPGRYRACLEINVEGDYNSTFNELTLPSPRGPGKQGETWDATFTGYGYAYRGQPSVLYCTDFAIGGGFEQTSATQAAMGSAGTWDLTTPEYGGVYSLDGVSDDPVAAPGSGADRLRAGPAGERLSVVVKPAAACRGDQLPSAVQGLSVERYPERLHAHQWARLRFFAAADDRGIARYDVRVSNTPIVDDATFIAATPAKQATLEAPELLVPTAFAAGAPIVVDTGGLVERTRYTLAVRAVDGCANAGPIQSVAFETPERVFSTVTPCFVATAAWGTPLAAEIGALRRLRDRHLGPHAAGRALLGAYQRLGPPLARTIAAHDRLRALVRVLLQPLVAAAHWLDRDSSA